MKIKVKELKNILFKDLKERTFTGFTVTKHRDVNGSEYELQDEQSDYVYAFELFNNKVYIREDYLLDVLLTKYAKPIEDNEIYEHGYPEARLMPSNFYEDCNMSYIESVKVEFSDRIEEILSDYINPTYED